MIQLATQSRRDDALVVFVHIPKTAGSTVNAQLAHHLGPGSKRVIHMMDRPALLRWTCARARWVSGHVHYPLLRSAIGDATNRPQRYVTVVRDPVKKLASHYNWFIEIHRRGPLTYYRYSARQRAVSAEIRATDNSDPKAIIGVLRRYRGLFLNHQARFLLGMDGLKQADDAALRGALTTFDYAGRAEDLNGFYAALGISADGTDRVNASPYDFDPEIFRGPELTRFLNKNNTWDQRLYDIVTG